MKQVCSVFHIQLSLLINEKGMLLFYLLYIAAAGILLPFFIHGIESTLVLAGSFAVLLAKPVLSDSMAGERDKRTLESLLSAPISGRTILYGKLMYSLLFTLLFFFATLICSVFTNYFLGYKLNMPLWQWTCIIPLTVLNFAVISVAGSYASAVSPDTRTANGRVSRIAYPFGLLNVIFLSAVPLLEMVHALIAGLALAAFYLLTITLYVVKISKMRHSDYLENIKTQTQGPRKEASISSTAPKSQFGIVFRHEWKLLISLKTLLLNFLLLCFAPAIVVLLLKYFTGTLNLYYGILLTAVMMPRAPSNLIAYSIGGEKVYKTGESLLSTPLHLRPVFLAKSMIPILVSSVMLALSSFLTLISANLASAFGESSTVYRYTADQLVLLFPVGIMACITMVFITGILTVIMKTPRQGLYAASIAGLAFAVPPSAIMLLAENRLKWSLLYLITLFLVNTFCVKSISGKITRPQIMSKL